MLLSLQELLVGVGWTSRQQKNNFELIRAPFHWAELWNQPRLRTSQTTKWPWLKSSSCEELHKGEKHIKLCQSNHRSASGGPIKIKKVRKQVCMNETLKRPRIVQRLTPSLRYQESKHVVVSETGLFQYHCSHEAFANIDGENATS